MRVFRGKHGELLVLSRKVWMSTVAGICAVGLTVGLLVGLWPGGQGSLTADGSTAVEQPVFGVSGVVQKAERVEIATATREFQSPETMPLYRVAPAGAATRDAMSQVATILGLGEHRHYSSEGVTESRIGISFPRPEDGACFCMRDQDALGELESEFAQGVEIGLPSPDEARNIAGETFEELGLSEGLTYRGASVRDRFTECALGQADRSVDVTIGVWYEASVGGLPLVGPGAKVYVVLGPEGEIVEVCHYAQRATESGKRVQLRSISTAAEDLKRGLGRSPNNITEDDLSEVIVEEVRLGYHAAPMPMGVLEYRPVYLLKVRLAGGSVGEWIVSAYAEGTQPVFGD